MYDSSEEESSINDILEISDNNLHSNIIEQALQAINVVDPRQLNWPDLVKQIFKNHEIKINVLNIYKIFVEKNKLFQDSKIWTE